MKLLAFETATEACSVALWIDGEVAERFERRAASPRRARAAVGRGIAGRGGHRAVAARRDRGRARPGCVHRRAAGDRGGAGHRAGSGPAAGAGVDARGAGDARGRPPRARRHRCAHGRGLPGRLRARSRACAPLSEEAAGSAGVGGGARGRCGTAWGPGSPRSRVRWRTGSRMQRPHGWSIWTTPSSRTRRTWRGWRRVEFERGAVMAADAVEPAYLRNNVALTLAEQRALRK